MNTHDSLVQVETNNLGYIGEKTADADNRILTYYGEDRGAQIELTNSTFKSSSFFKGLVYYSKFQSLGFEEAPVLLNYTANFAGNKSVAFKDQEAKNYIKIENSQFKNIGFQQVIDALYRRDYQIQKSREDFVKDIDWLTFQN